MSEEILVQAKRAIVSPGVEIHNVLVRIEGGIIVDVCKNLTPTATAIDLGDVTLVPGFINSHTHLEFSDIEAPLGRAGMPFVDWLNLVIDQRIATSGSEGAKSNAIQTGICESVGAGVVAIGEIATSPLVMSNYDSDDVHLTLFFERLSRNPDLTSAVAAECATWLTETSPDCGDQLTKAVSPHAPYSVHPLLFEQLVQQAIEYRRPVAVHLAETREELRLLHNCDGPFVDFLKSVSAWYPDTYSNGTRILDYLKLLSRVPQCLVVHGNFLDDEEIAFVAKQQNMFVVFCPRTHEYFHHDEYPLTKYLEAGIKVVIGTDSRASNPDLCVFEELKTVRRRFPCLGDIEILNMATNASALGMRKDANLIEVGSAARINVIKSPCPDQLFGANSGCRPLEQYLAHA